MAQSARDNMRLPDGKTCKDCLHVQRCEYLISRKGTETECDFYPSMFCDDVLTIYNRDGTTTEIKHPFQALQALESEKK